MTKNKIILLSSVVSMLYGFDADAAFSRAAARRAATQQARLAQQNANSLPVQAQLTQQPAMPAPAQPNVQSQQNATPAQGGQYSNQTMSINVLLSGRLKEVNGIYTMENSELKVCKLSSQYVVMLPLAHPYNGMPSAIFSVTSEDKECIRRALNLLNVSGGDVKKFNLVISSLESASCTAPIEPFAFKPQWRFIDAYDGQHIESKVSPTVKCYNNDEGKTIIDYHFNKFYEGSLSFHPSEGGFLAASPDVYNFGFNNDGISRALLYYTKYESGALAGQAEVGIIFLYNRNDFQTIMNCLQNCFKEKGNFFEQWDNINFIHKDIKDVLDMKTLKDITEE